MRNTYTVITKIDVRKESCDIRGPISRGVLFLTKTEFGVAGGPGIAMIQLHPHVEFGQMRHHVSSGFFLARGRGGINILCFGPKELLRWAWGAILFVILKGPYGSHALGAERIR